MSKPPESEVIQKFHDRIDAGEITDIEIVYRITGGMPDERKDIPEISLSGAGASTVTVRDPQGISLLQEASAELDQAETQALFQQMRSGIDSLVIRSEARFLPDSLVGSITIKVNGEEATLYFLVDEKDRLIQGKPIDHQVAKAIEQLTRLSQKSLRSKKRRGS